MRDAILERLERDAMVATWHLKKVCGTTAKALKELKKLESEGKVRKVERYSNANNYIWELVV